MSSAEMHTECRLPHPMQHFYRPREQTTAAGQEGRVLILLAKNEENLTNNMNHGTVKLRALISGLCTVRVPLAFWTASIFSIWNLYNVPYKSHSSLIYQKKKKQPLLNLLSVFKQCNFKTQPLLRQKSKPTTTPVGTAIFLLSRQPLEHSSVSIKKLFRSVCF